MSPCRLKQVMLAAGAMAWGSACHADTSSPLPEAALRAENARWAEASARHDFAALGALYTLNGELLPPDEHRVVGRAAIANYFEQWASATAPHTITFSRETFYGNAQEVTEISDSALWDEHGKCMARGKQILIFLKQNGHWLIHSDMWNSSPLASPN